jgi:hypothetical protein
MWRSALLRTLNWLPQTEHSNLPGSSRHGINRLLGSRPASKKTTNKK